MSYLIDKFIYFTYHIENKLDDWSMIELVELFMPHKVSHVWIPLFLLLLLS